MGRILRSLVLLGVVLSTAANSTANCPQGCRLDWQENIKAVLCRYANFQEIPGPLSTEIDRLLLEGNNLTEIKSHAFVQLVNLQVLNLENCKLLLIHKNGFRGLAHLELLDLSKNQLKRLQPYTFKEIVNIRFIVLNDNFLEELDDGLFNNLPFLHTVFLNNNRLTHVGEKTFLHVPQLTFLYLEGNKLEYMNADTFSSLSIELLDVRDNPWSCDCNLRAFINWYMDKFHYPGNCTEPAKLQGKLWEELTSHDFDCPSTVIANASTTLLETISFYSSYAVMLAALFFSTYLST